jgi:hypothetical protein
MGKRKGTKKTNNGQKKRDKKDKQWAKEKGQKRQTMGKRKGTKKTNNDLQNIHIKLKIEKHEPH